MSFVRDDAPRPPALTGSNRLFQTTTMSIPNSGKSERGRRHTRHIYDRQYTTCQKNNCPIPLTARKKMRPNKSSKQPKKNQIKQQRRQREIARGERLFAARSQTLFRALADFVRMRARCSPVQSPCTLFSRRARHGVSPRHKFKTRQETPTSSLRRRTTRIPELRWVHWVRRPRKGRGSFCWASRRWSRRDTLWLRRERDRALDLWFEVYGANCIEQQFFPSMTTTLTSASRCACKIRRDLDGLVFSWELSKLLYVENKKRKSSSCSLR